MAYLLVAAEDEPTRTLLAENLRADGYEVNTAGSAAAAKKLLDAELYDLILADVNGDALDLADFVGWNTPLIALTGRVGGEMDEIRIVRLLERGADDVVGKPFSYLELRARIDNQIRAHGAKPRSRLIGPLQIQPSSRTVTVEGRGVELANKEYELLLALSREPHRVWTKQELLRDVWGFRGLGERTRTLDSHASRLRRRLDPDRGRFVVNCWGVGYKLVDEGVVG